MLFAVEDDTLFISPLFIISSLSPDVYAADSAATPTPPPLILIDFPALFITVFPKAVLLLWIYIPVPAAAFNVPLFVTIFPAGDAPVI